jgi:hypothetical protein
MQDGKYKFSIPGVRATLRTTKSDYFDQYPAVMIIFEVWHDLNILSDRFAHNTELHFQILRLILYAPIPIL